MSAKAPQVSAQDLAYALPGAFANYASGGAWRYARHLKLIEDKVMDIVNGKQVRLMVSLPPRHGKEIADSTPVLTTKGWKTHGELLPGDEVFHPSGRPTKVLYVHPPGMDFMEVEFTNGEKIKCHPNHEWVLRRRMAKKDSVIETRQLAKERLRDKRSCGTFAYNYKLPLIEPLQFPERDLPVHPYVLGAWLGDGHHALPNIYAGVKKLPIIDRIRELGYELAGSWTDPRDNVTQFSFAGTPRNPGKLTKGLQALGVIKNKHIPDCYLRCSVKQRLELLAGLIDTDGSVSKECSTAYFSSSRQHLAEAVVELIRSFGWRATLVKDYKKTSFAPEGTVIYTITFSPKDFVPTRVLHKRIIKRGPRRHIAVRSVKQAFPEPGRCITVGSEDGMYLVGKQLIPTHNSMFISHYLPAWYLGRFPQNRVILVSYQQRYAQQYGRKARNVLRIYGPEIFGVGIADDASSVDHWETTQGGSMSSTSVGSALTGKGANLLLLDDTLKGREEALNANYLDNLWDYYGSDVRSRLEPKGSIILLNTRWAVKDLIGRLRHLSESTPHADKWTELVLPALAEENDPLERKPGEALWPERFSREDILLIKNSGITPFFFSAVYQQRPVPLEGTLVNIHWFRRYRVVPSEQDREMTIFSFDTASKDGELNDFSVLQIWVVKAGFYYLVHQVRERLRFPALVKLSVEMKNIWRPNAMLIEDKGSGIGLIQTLRDLGTPVIPINPVTSKAVRFDAETAAIQGGQVFLPDTSLQTPWLAELEEEIMSFPNSQYDDQCDAMSQALSWLRLKRKLSDFDVW